MLFRRKGLPRTMLVICPHCTSSYFVRSEKIRHDGQMMRCGVCQTRFQVDAKGAEETESSLAEPEPDMPLEAERAPPPPAIADPLPAFEEVQNLTNGPFRVNRMIGLMAAGLASFVGLVGVISYDRLKSESNGLMAALLPGSSQPRLSFDQITSRIEGEGSDQTLVIEGFILSNASEPHPLPGLSFEIRADAQGAKSGERIFQWMIPPPAPTIVRGSPVPFRARLASPPRQGKDIVIRLAGA